MKISQIMGKKAVVIAIAAAAAFVAGPAGADEIPPGANTAHDPGVPAATSVTLAGRNFTKGCVRLYVGGQHDVQAGQPYEFKGVKAGKDFMASVFPGRCGGAAVRNVWFRTSGARPTNRWDIR